MFFGALKHYSYLLLITYIFILSLLCYYVQIKITSWFPIS